uniref:Protein kinase domain-containing protein n=1 Tax=Romanomermis culicivorax TaxID=13658 RepID=A0A915IP01_ROMCU
MSTFSLKRTFDFASNDQSNSQTSKKAKFYVTLVKPTVSPKDQTSTSVNSLNQRALVYKIVKQPSIVDDAPSSPSTSAKTNDPIHPSLGNEEEALEAHDKSTLKSNFLAPQLSLLSTNDEFLTSTTSGRNTESNLANVDGNRQKIVKFIGDYEIIREANSDQQVSDQRRAFIVKELDGSSNIGLCRCITFEKYLHYFELYGKLSAQSSEDVNFCDDSSSEEVMERIWPRRSKLFMSRDEISGEKRYYLFTPRHYGSLHVHVVDRKKLDSLQALRLYKQIVEAAAYCHSRGIILRDVKLRKFVFADEQRRNVRFFDLDEFHILADPRNDTIRERNGCPAYVSPEIIDFQSNSEISQQKVIRAQAPKMTRKPAYTAELPVGLDELRLVRKDGNLKTFNNFLLRIRKKLAKKSRNRLIDHLHLVEPIAHLGQITI